MKLEGIFPEYLIIGSLSLVWTIPIVVLIQPSFSLSDTNSLEVLIAVPFVYTLGMLLDYLSYLIFKRKTLKVKQSILGKKDVKMVSYYYTIISVTYLNSDLTKELSMRLSRARVARGILINTIFILITIPVFFMINFNLTALISSILLIVAVFLFVNKMYKHYLEFFFRYEKELRDFKEKLDENRKEG